MCIRDRPYYYHLKRVLNDNNTVDINLTNKLVKAAGKLDVTFHKAIDSCDNILEELRMIINNTRVSTILTSGGFKDAFAGHEVIKEMIKISGKNISIIVAGSVTSDNISSITNSQVTGLASSKLTGVLPAVDGSALTGLTEHTQITKSASDPT